MKEFKNIKAAATIEELYGPAVKLAMEDSPDAKEYFDALVDQLLKDESINRQDAVEIVKSNIGYYAGYFSNEARQKVWDVYGSSHPIFGNEFPSAKHAFEIGMRIAKNSYYGNGNIAKSR